MMKNNTEVNKLKAQIEIFKKELESMEWGARKTNEGIKLLYKELEGKNKELKTLGMLKDELTQLIVHDLRSPLTSMKGWLRCLEIGIVGKLTEEQKQVLSKVINSCEMQRALVNDLLDITILEENKLKLEKKFFSIYELVNFCLSQIEVRAKIQNITLSKYLEPNLPPLNADERLIQRVLLNLLDNSLKFTGKGGEITVTVKYLSDRNQYIFSVLDTGSGIPEEYLNRIFDKFIRVEMEKRVPGAGHTGKGLGLTFCRLVVEAHNGRIWAESQEGKGSKFSFALPGEN